MTKFLPSSPSGCTRQLHTELDLAHGILPLNELYREPFEEAQFNKHTDF